MKNLIKDLNACMEFKAGDNSKLRELFHADKGKYAFRYSLAHAVVKPREITLAHRLKTSEMYYILEGKGRMYIDGQSSDVYPGCAIYIPPYSRQYIENKGDTDLKFLCIVDPAWRPEDEEIDQ